MSAVTAVPIQPTSRRVLAMLWSGIVLALLAAVALAWLGTGAAVAKAGTNEEFLAWNARQPGVQTTASGLQYKVLKPGEGGHPTDADVALIKYKGTLRDGTVFDENERAPLPVAQVVPGFSEGLKQMQKGGQYRLWIKPELGYGDRETGPIPANSLLVFDVQLLEFVPMAVLQQMQMQQMMGGQGGPQGGR
ncbi:MAG TPA: FKBP-type peptidyl-prolyl cis-trans isomerase [Sphingomonas sp.]|nr:FKBP-type peptidyl-prolyl cis-trans isomerase [Sphingomonas sp.]